MQAKIKENIYCQQCGSSIELVYVNQLLANVYINAKDELSEKELFKLGESLLKAIDQIPSLIDRKEKIASEYNVNPNRDGVIF